jgi:preprotein translocase subunit SecD
MARKTARPGRTLMIFFVGLAVAFGLVALAGSWKPELGLDLQGGTSIRLTPDGSPSKSSLNEARKIIDQRVNGSGVTEAEVTVQGNRFIVVEIPGKSRRDLVETVRRQAQLRFRLAACSDSNPGPCAGAVPTSPTDPGTGVTQPPSPDATGDPSAEPSAPASEQSPSGNNRAPVGFADGSGSPSPSASGQASDEPTDEPSETPADADPSASGTADPEQIPAPDGGKDVDDPLKWMDSPNQAAVDAFNQFSCPPAGTPANVEDDPKKPLVTCDQQGQKYLLSASMIEGTDLDSASAQIPQNQVAYVVLLDFDSDGTKTFTEISKALVGTEKQFAIVLDGQVISAPTMDGLITNGQAQISGQFTPAEAKSLATSLKYGALPISFKDFSAETVGPSLAGDQLNAGLLAGMVGLILVMIYCMVYYRGLGFVVVSSLLVAGAATYAMVLLLSKTANFTLTLPGIAGLIVAVGITADSFIVYFERIRDEMRDGKSMRVAVESGWVRARNTCLAADAVSLLAAVVLYIFAAGVVRGFAFALGLSTLIDLVVFFWFTKPLVSTLARFRFYNTGSRFSGLSADTLGIERITHDRPQPSTVGGRL